MNLFVCKDQIKITHEYRLYVGVDPCSHGYFEPSTQRPQIACKYERFDGHVEERIALNMIFNVTYYLESRNSKFVDGISKILPTNANLVVGHSSALKTLLCYKLHEKSTNLALCKYE